MKEHQCIVFTDLDGTLLDHHSYSWEPARPALEALARLGFPLVLASSKTAAEMGALRQSLPIQPAPMIVENGAGVLPAGAEAGTDRSEHARLLAILNSLPPDLRAGFEGFSEWGAAGIAAHTGLDAAAAARAAKRQFSEPGVWRGNEDKRADFITALAERGVTARSGGRYLTLSFGATKADRMREILTQAGARVSLALGDAPNDVEMLETATRGVIIRNDAGKPLPPLDGEAEGRITRTTDEGPTGWNRAVLEFLTEMTVSADAAQEM